MARGWESKAVEAQQQDQEDRRNNRQATAPADRQRVEQRRALELARARTRADLKTCTSSAHRSMLEQALRDLDEQLRRMT
jgi:hypothetical protein